MGLLQNLQSETVNRLPLRQAIAIEPDTIVRSAVAKMRTAQLGCAVIVDSAGKPTGIFTERSVIDVLMCDASLDSTRVTDYAETEWLQVKTSDPIARVLHAVQHEGLRFVCVTDEDGKLVGLTGQRGLSEYISEHFPQQVMVQRFGGTPKMQQREGA